MLLSYLPAFFYHLFPTQQSEWFFFSLRVRSCRSVVQTLPRNTSEFIMCLLLFIMAKDLGKWTPACHSEPIFNCSILSSQYPSSYDFVLVPQTCLAQAYSSARLETPTNRSLSGFTLLTIDISSSIVTSGSPSLTSWSTLATYPFTSSHHLVCFFITLVTVEKYDIHLWVYLFIYCLPLLEWNSKWPGTSSCL